MQFQSVKLGLIILLFTSYSANSSNYVGLDYNIRPIEGRDRNGYAMRQVLPQIYHGFEVYAAHRFDNDVGLSLGWQQSRVEDRNHTFTAGEAFLGDPQNAGDRTSIRGRVQALHIDLTGYLNVTDNVEAVGEIGVALMRVAMNGTIQSGGVTTNLAPSRNFGNIIPRLGLGIMYFPTVFDKIKMGVRALINWEATDMYHISMVDDDGVRASFKPFKSSWVYSVGLVGKF